MVESKEDINFIAVFKVIIWEGSMRSSVFKGGVRLVKIRCFGEFLGWDWGLGGYFIGYRVGNLLKIVEVWVLLKIVIDFFI